MGAGREAYDLLRRWGWGHLRKNGFRVARQYVWGDTFGWQSRFQRIVRGRSYRRLLQLVGIISKYNDHEYVTPENAAKILEGMLRDEDQEAQHKYPDEQRRGKNLRAVPSIHILKCPKCKLARIEIITKREPKAAVCHACTKESTPGPLRGVSPDGVCRMHGSTRTEIVMMLERRFIKCSACGFEKEYTPRMRKVRNG